jgi:hypothetical protein
VDKYAMLDSNDLTSFGFNNASASEHGLGENSELSLTMKRIKDMGKQRNAQKGASQSKLKNQSHIYYKIQYSN